MQTANCFTSSWEHPNFLDFCLQKVRTKWHTKWRTDNPRFTTWFSYYYLFAQKAKKKKKLFSFVISSHMKLIYTFSFSIQKLLSNNIFFERAYCIRLFFSPFLKFFLAWIIQSRCNWYLWVSILKGEFKAKKKIYLDTTSAR